MKNSTFTKEPCIRHCCRQDENGELVDKSEYSETDVTLAVVSNGEVACMECGNNLLNARLIAAAPELFKQCKLFEDVLTELAHEGEPEAMEMRNELREILAKVEGEK